jgi:signal-transduction protein with cAMP-binding, CBS, and nucleotidyltransferase domain
MHLPSKQPDALSNLAFKCRALTEALVANLQTADEPFHVQQAADLFSALPTTQLLLINEGQVSYHINGKLIMLFEAGDLLGLPRSLSLPEGTFSCNSPVTLTAYDRDDLVDHINSDSKRQKNWAYYLLCQISFYQQSLAQEIRTEFQPAAGFIHFRLGETIIHQGAPADRVYTLLEGTADAVCDGVKVGEIHADEIFGALAVFTRQPRMASVVATSDCTVLAVRKEEFVDLINHQPQICMGLIEEMAAKINQLNNHLLSLADKTIW